MLAKKLLATLTISLAILTQAADVQAETDSGQIAEYEKSLDIYNFNQKIDWKNLENTAKKLQAIDPQNVIAFRASVYSYRNNYEIKRAIAFCKATLKSKPTPALAIEANYLLGDIYYNEMKETLTAQQFANKAISLVKKNYSAAEIEKLVNGSGVIVDGLQLSGHTNTVRELYILKSEIEGVNPEFESVSKADGLTLVEDKIYNIKYRTKW